MKKLSLNPEELRVESFATAAEESERGTVLANAYTERGYPSCDPTCGVTPPPDTEICGLGIRPTVRYCCV